jgi:hypothetical protein
LDDWDKSFSQSVAIRITLVWYQASAQRVRPGHACLEGWAGGREPLEPFEFFNYAETTRRAQFAAHHVFAPLVVGRRAKAPGRRAFQFETFEVTVEGKVEIQAGLLSVSDNVESGGDLVVNGRDDGIVFQFGAVGLTESVEVLAGELEPSRERVAADNGGAEWTGFHLGSALER